MFYEMEIAVMFKEYKYMEDLEVMSGAGPESLTAEQKRKPLREVNLIKLKSSGKLKGRICANGAPHHKFVPKEEAKSQIITMEGLLTTMVIDAYEDTKVENFDIPGSYLQTGLPKEQFMLLLMEGKFVDIMSDINPEYKKHARFKDGSKTSYLRILKAMHEMIKSALLWNELYVSVLKYMGFQLNPYDMCG